MRSRLSLLLLAALPATLHANGFRRFDNYCTTGAFVSCASVTIRVTSLAGGQTVLVVTMRNLEGTHPADNSPGSILRNLVLDWNVPADPTWNTFGPTVTSRGVNLIQDPYAFLDTDIESSGLNINMFGSGVVGCHAPQIPSELPPGFGTDSLHAAFQTCPALGAGGALVFTFQTDQHTDWDVNRLSLRLDYDSFSAGGPISCTVNVDCFQVTVTPEPVTFVLLATGLVGLGVFARRISVC